MGVEADLRAALEELQRDLDTRSNQLTEARRELFRAQDALRDRTRVYNDTLEGLAFQSFDQWTDKEKWNAATLELRRVVDQILAEPPATKAEILARMRVALAEGSASWAKRSRAGKRTPSTQEEDGDGPNSPGRR